MTKYQDAEASSRTEVPEDMDADANFLPVVPEDHKVPVLGARNEGNTQNTPEYVRTMD